MKTRRVVLPHCPNYAHVKITFIRDLECFFLKNQLAGEAKVQKFSKSRNKVPSS
jgi:hypothetical protein